MPFYMTDRSENHHHFKLVASPCAVGQVFTVFTVRHELQYSQPAIPTDRQTDNIIIRM